MQVGEVHLKYIDWLDSKLDTWGTNIGNEYARNHPEYTGSWFNLGKDIARKIVNSLRERSYGSVDELLNAIVNARSEDGYSLRR
mgnify:FL=1